MRRERPAPITFTEEEGEIVFDFVTGDGEMQSHRRFGEDERVPRELLVEGPHEKALEAYRALREASPEEPWTSEGYLHNVGLDAVNDGRFDVGIALLRFAANLYPPSQFNATPSGPGSLTFSRLASAALAHARGRATARGRLAAKLEQDE